MNRRTLLPRTICAAAILALALGACGSDGPVADLRPSSTVDDATPSPTDPLLAAEPSPTEAPLVTDAAPVTDAAAPTPAPLATEPAPTPEQPAPEQPAPEPEQPAPEPTPQDPNPVVPDDDDNGWLLTLLIVGGLLLAAVVVVAAIVRSRKSEPDRGTSPTSPQSNLLSTSQWIIDQLSLELMVAPPAAALQRWSVERSRLDNVAIGAQQQYLEAQDANWQPLAQTMSSLASAIETNLALRAQEPPNAPLIDESTAVVNRHRTNLQALIAALWPTINR